MPQPKRVSAFNRALQEAQQVESPTVETQQNVKTVSQQSSITIPQQASKTVKKQEKVMLYLTPNQLNKLEDFAYEHRKRTGKRTNLNDIMRHLIDKSTSESFADLE